MNLVETHRIRPSHKHFKLLREFCINAKKLYNHANYIVRQRFFKENYWTRYKELDKTLKADVTYPDYKNMPTAQSAQQVLRQLDTNWKTFFKAIKDWKQHPEKYLECPKLPKYKRSQFILTLTNQNCKIKGQQLVFPKVFNGFSLEPKFIVKSYTKFCLVNLIPKNGELLVQIVYEIEDRQFVQDNQRYTGIDLGVNNLATCVSNVIVPEVVNGRPLKAINQYYNKMLSHLKSKAMKINGVYTSKHIQKLTSKRNRKIDDYLHKASKHIVDRCIKYQIHTIIIGKNINWKQHSTLSKKINQQFISIPFNKLIEMIKYKASCVGITVKLTEESYTSGTSFLDHELPIKENYNKRRRIHRGLFKSNKGILINADVNGAYQIIQKVVPNIFMNGIEGVGLHPMLWTPEHKDIY